MMSDDQIKKSVLSIIGRIAPEADIEKLDPDERLRNQFDFDSVDFMNFAAAIKEDLHVEIPEEDYLQLSTLNSCIAYLKSRLDT